MTHGKIELVFNNLLLSFLNAFGCVAYSVPSTVFTPLQVHTTRSVYCVFVLFTRNKKRSRRPLENNTTPLLCNDNQLKPFVSQMSPCNASLANHTFGHSTWGNLDNEAFCRSSN